MQDHLTNVIGPRLTGSPAYKRAAEWSRARFEEWGLEAARLEPFSFGRGWTLEKLTLEMLEPRYQPLLGYPEAWTPSTDGELVGTVRSLVGKTAEDLAALGDGLRGAIVITRPRQTRFVRADRPQPTAGDAAEPGGPQQNTRRQQQQQLGIGRRGNRRARGNRGNRISGALLQQAGAAVWLKPNSGEHGTLFVLGRRDTSDDAVPAIVVAAEQYNMIVRLAEHGVPVKLRVEVAATYHEDDPNSYNVLAEIPGVDPDLDAEVVMAGAHLDCWHSSPGATDNADGSATLLEAARILRAVGARPRRTIRFALWGGEEQGLLGSRAWVRQHLHGDENRTARERLSVYFNNDPGTGRTYGWFMENRDDVMPIFDEWLAPLRDLGARRNVMSGIGSTDHLNFLRVGVPAFNSVQDYVDYDVRTHHTNFDTFERVQQEDLQQAAIVLASFVYRAAMRDRPIPRR